MSSSHRMSGAPGAYCLSCGNEFAVESQLVCPDCVLTDDGEVVTACPLHNAWARAMASGCPPELALVTEVNRLLAAASAVSLPPASPGG
jgi:hypothetical protein